MRMKVKKATVLSKSLYFDEYTKRMWAIKPIKSPYCLNQIFFRSLSCAHHSKYKDCEEVLSFVCLLFCLFTLQKLSFNLVGLKVGWPPLWLDLAIDFPIRQL